MRQLCESPDRALRMLGKQPAYALRQFLADVRAAGTVAELALDMRLGRVHSDVGLFELSDGIVLEYEPNHNAGPRLQSGAVDWARVTRVKITSVGPPRA